jgi:hypothetical protein
VFAVTNRPRCVRTWTFTSHAFRGRRCNNRGRDHRVHGQRQGLRCLADRSSRRVRPELRGATATVVSHVAQLDVRDYQRDPGARSELDFLLSEGLRRHEAGTGGLGQPDRGSAAVQVVQALCGNTVSQDGVEVRRRLEVSSPRTQETAVTAVRRALRSCVFAGIMTATKIQLVMTAGDSAHERDRRGDDRQFENRSAILLLAGCS